MTILKKTEKPVKLMPADHSSLGIDYVELRAFMIQHCNDREQAIADPDTCHRKSPQYEDIIPAS